MILLKKIALLVCLLAIFLLGESCGNAIGSNSAETGATSQAHSPPVQSNIKSEPTYVDAAKATFGSGKAEINVYEIKQNRYNALHSGQLISITVTEDFLIDKQVKNEQYSNPNSTLVLKNIQLRKFNTGLYDYSMFSSVFTPIERDSQPHSLKVSGSSQDWCGHTYLQLNKEANNYRYTLHSYFESEADQNQATDLVILEDELFNLIRMGPAEQLPQGKFKMIPSVNYLQLTHKDIKAYDCEAEKGSYMMEDGTPSKAPLDQYRIHYPELNRTLTIVYNFNPPYKIMGWDDAYPSAFDQKVRTTEVTLQKSKFIDYWNKHQSLDAILRDSLGIE